MSRDPRQDVLRSFVQRLESLRRAGLDRVPVIGPEITTTAARAAPHAEPTAVAVSAPSTAPAPRPIPAPAPAPIPAVDPVLAATGSLFGEEGLDGPELPIQQRAEALQAQASEVAPCTRCAQLAAARTRTVFGVGHPGARLMFIGEAPGADEDRQGEPFVGRAGQLLTDMITKGMGLRREDVYIANILKCRPPGNRDPEPGEVANCIGYLERQIATIRPEYLCLLGRIAAQTLLDTAMPMTRLRGKWHRYKGIPTLVTFHPAYLLRRAEEKPKAWEDLKMLMRALGLKVPERKKPRAGD